jgi:hypothetical protein
MLVAFRQSKNRCRLEGGATKTGTAERLLYRAGFLGMTTLKAKEGGILRCAQNDRAIVCCEG